MKVKLKLFDTGYCTGKESLAIKGGRAEPCEFHAPFALIKHPQHGYCLFDTGYSHSFYDATAKFPYNIYAKLTPVFHKQENDAVNQLKKIGIQSQDIKKIIISHFHADHIGGLKDFLEAEFLCAEVAYASIKGKKGFAALAKGFLPDLLPSDFESRVSFIDSHSIIDLDAAYAPFNKGYDIFGDGSVIAIHLEGHACGQMGVLLETTDGPCFLVGDACWLSRSYRENRAPSSLASFIFSDRKEYFLNFGRLHELHQRNPSLKIIPTHCPEVLKLIDNSR